MKNKNLILQGLGATAFIIGFIIISYVAWLLLIGSNPVSALEIRDSGPALIIGLAFIANGLIVILLTKREQHN